MPPGLSRPAPYSTAILTAVLEEPDDDLELPFWRPGEAFRSAWEVASRVLAATGLCAIAMYLNVELYPPAGRAMRRLSHSDVVWVSCAVEALLFFVLGQAAISDFDAFARFHKTYVRGFSDLRRPSARLNRDFVAFFCAMCGATFAAVVASGTLAQGCDVREGEAVLLASRRHVFYSIMASCALLSFLLSFSVVFLGGGVDRLLMLIFRHLRESELTCRVEPASRQEASAVAAPDLPYGHDAPAIVSPWPSSPVASPASSVASPAPLAQTFAAPCPAVSYATPPQRRRTTYAHSGPQSFPMRRHLSQEVIYGHVLQMRWSGRLGKSRRRWKPLLLWASPAKLRVLRPGRPQRRRADAASLDEAKEPPQEDSGERDSSSNDRRVETWRDFGDFHDFHDVLSGLKTPPPLPRISETGRRASEPPPPRKVSSAGDLPDAYRVVWEGARGAFGAVRDSSVANNFYVVPREAVAEGPINSYRDEASALRNPFLSKNRHDRLLFQVENEEEAQRWVDILSSSP